MMSLEKYYTAVHDPATYTRKLSQEELSRKLALDQDLRKLRRQLELLEADMEKVELFTPGDEGRKGHIQDNMTKVKNRVLETEAKIRDIYLQPYAEAIWQEGEAIQHKLRHDMQEQFGKACEVKETYIRELAKLGQLKRMSDIAANEASKVRLALQPPRNPMEGIKISNESSFVVGLVEIQKLTR